ncbi:hypothetical protein [Limnoglobus roseus]|uniref:hypothetical protein n=1 Tax=Limnoglobus roseus TaxID=2598579 RepID=UPI00143DD459|nr:hypothetical protein [Limnoglobus roseus]
MVRRPAFEEGAAWEIRQQAEGWRAFRSRVVGGSWPDVRLVGYDPLKVDSAPLEGFFIRLAALSVPVSPLNGRAGVDGTSFQLAAFDLFCEWRVSWWEEPPPQWEGFGRIATEMVALFATAEIDCN